MASLSGGLLIQSARQHLQETPQVLSMILDPLAHFAIRGFSLCFMLPKEGQKFSKTGFVFSSASHEMRQAWADLIGLNLAILVSSGHSTDPQ